MSLIDPQPQVERMSVNVEVDTAKHVRAYAKMIRSTQEWTVNKALKYFFEHDRTFKKWLAEQPPEVEPGTPMPGGRPKELSS